VRPLRGRINLLSDRLRISMSEDEQAIAAIISSQSQSLNWTPEKPARWDNFIGDFLSSALLYPAARPLKPITPAAFVERMKGLAASSLKSFHEDKLDHRIHVFGNIAVAIAGCAMAENGSQSSHSVEMFLLVKSDGAWRIAAQAWEPESQANRIPDDLFAS
jgi:hypothetical protein